MILLDLLINLVCRIYFAGFSLFYGIQIVVYFLWLVLTYYAPLGLAWGTWVALTTLYVASLAFALSVLILEHIIFVLIVMLFNAARVFARILHYWTATSFTPGGRRPDYHYALLPVLDSALRLHICLIGFAANTMRGHTRRVDHLTRKILEFNNIH